MAPALLAGKDGKDGKAKHHVEVHVHPKLGVRLGPELCFWPPKVRRSPWNGWEVGYGKGSQSRAKINSDQMDRMGTVL